MPAKKLLSGKSEAASAFSIVGMYSEPAGEEFVRHVAILAEDSQLQWARLAPVWHMGPPLVAGERSKKTPNAKLQIPVHVIGSVPLDLDDREGIANWLEEVDKEPPPDNPHRRYLAVPHWDWYTAPETGRRLYRRFSCAGFVLECYGSIGIDLVNTDEDVLPDVYFEMLVKAYPEIKSVKFLRKLDIGITGNEPWRLVMAGYVFHALDKISKESPTSGVHTPEAVTEAFFPGSTR